MAGVVDQDIDTSEVFARRANNPSTVQCAGQIGGHERSFTD